MRYASRMILTAAAAAAIGCGGKASNQQAAPPAPPSEAAGGAAAAGLTMPDWMQVDQTAKTVTMTVDGGKPGGATQWNFNGYTNGEATITVPEGFEVTIHFHNADQAMPHSLAILDQIGNYPATFENPTPVFPGAMSPDPTDLTKGTQPGQSVDVKFTAAKAGNYAMVCLMPPHALTGMWIRFDVSSDGSAGLKTGA